MSHLPKNVLITGASSGLGRGLASWFASRGSVVTAVARRGEALERLRQQHPAQVLCEVLDVAQADETHHRLQQLDAERGFDLVIANAGVGNDVSAKATDWSRVSQIIDVNVKGAIATLTAVLPGMVERGRGHLVGVSSLAGLLSMPRAATYGASKAFLTMWLESIRLDLADTPLAVTTIQPGFVRSEMTAKYRERSMPFLLDTDDAVERMANAIVRRKPVFAFPLVPAVGLKVLSTMPRPLRAAAGRRFRA